MVDCRTTKKKLDTLLAGKDRSLKDRWQELKISQQESRYYSESLHSMKQIAGYVSARSSPVVQQLFECAVYEYLMSSEP